MTGFGEGGCRVLERESVWFLVECEFDVITWEIATNH